MKNGFQSLLIDRESDRLSVQITSHWRGGSLRNVPLVRLHTHTHTHCIRSHRTSLVSISPSSLPLSKCFLMPLDLHQGQRCKSRHKWQWSVYLRLWHGRRLASTLHYARTSRWQVTRVAWSFPLVAMTRPLLFLLMAPAWLFSPQGETVVPKFYNPQPTLWFRHMTSV